MEAEYRKEWDFFSDVDNYMHVTIDRCVTELGEKNYLAGMKVMCWDTGSK